MSRAQAERRRHRLVTPDTLFVGVHVIRLWRTSRDGTVAGSVVSLGDLGWHVMLRVLMPFYRTWPSLRSSGSSRSNTACTSGHTPAPRTAACPHCGRASARAHSRYQRRLADAAIGGRRVVLRLEVRRWFCDHPRLPGPHVHRTAPGTDHPLRSAHPLL